MTTFRVFGLPQIPHLDFRVIRSKSGAIIQFIGLRLASEGFERDIVPLYFG